MKITKQDFDKFPYHPTERLMSANELPFYEQLKLCVEQWHLTVMTKVRVASIFRPKDGAPWREYGGIVAGMEFDFVLMDDKAKVFCAVELDDTSHDSQDMELHDLWLDTACATANVRLLRFRTMPTNIYEAEHIEFQISQKLPPEDVEWLRTPPDKRSLSPTRLLRMSVSSPSGTPAVP